MNYDKVLEPISEICEACEALLSGDYGRLSNDARESIKTIYGGAGGLFALFTDIITSLGLENTAKRAFLAEKFKEHLRQVIDNSQALLAGMDGDLTEEQAVMLLFIQETGEKLLQHVHSIWLYSRLHLNLVAYPQTLIHIPAVLKTLRKPPVETAVKPTFFSDDPLPPVVGDERLLRRCVQELVNNAAKFSSGNLVIVHSYLNRDTLAIDVIDTGSGIDRRYLPRLFEPFYQEDRGVEGIGLGLTIAVAIARLLAGKIELTRTHIGIGSTFSLLLPAA